MVQRMMRTLVALALAAAILLPTVSASATDLDPGFEWTLQDPGRRASAIEADIAFREALHFESSRSYVESLYDDLARTVGTRAAGALFTPAELEELRRRDNLAHDTAVISEYYRTHPRARDNFGGVMVDHAAGGVVAVYLIDGSDQPWRDELTYPGQLRVRATTTTKDELDTLQDGIFREQGGDDTTGVLATFTSVRQQAVVVEIDAGKSKAQREATKRSVRERFGTKQVRFRETRRPKTAAAVKGGWSYYPAGCTLGLKVDRSTGDPDVRWYISAGHCSSLDTVHYHNGNRIGPAKERSFHNGGSEDALLIRVDDSSLGGAYTAAAKVVHKTGGVPYVLDVKRETPTHDVGNKRCMTGRVTGTTCGLIEDDDAPVLASGTQLYHMVRVEGIVRNIGDSGSPAYWHNTSDNTVKGAGSLSTINTSTDRAWYTPIERFESLGWNITLAKLTNSDGCRIPGLGGPSPNCDIDAGGDY